MPGTEPIEWRLHLRSSPEAAFDFWTSDAGRARFWSETSRATAAGFELAFVNGQSLDVEVVEAERPGAFAFRYFGGSLVTLRFEPDGSGGCDLLLREEGVPAAEFLDNHAGWVSVLMGFKAAIDFDIDLRSHDSARTWDERFVDC